MYSDTKHNFNTILKFTQLANFLEFINSCNEFTKSSEIRIRGFICSSVKREEGSQFRSKV